MNWRAFLKDLNLIWASLATVGAGLTGAFLAGQWIGRSQILGHLDGLHLIAALAGVGIALVIGLLAGRASAPGLRAALTEKDDRIATLSVKNEELEGRLREPVREPTPTALPDESVQVWLRPMGSEDIALTLQPAPLNILLVANLKGGVAKTMVAANLAAYFSRRANYPRTRELENKRVLLIDLDYQGSLSRLLLTAMKVGRRPTKSEAQTLFNVDVSDEDALQYSVRAGGVFQNLAFYPAEYGFDDFETREQFRWLAGEPIADVRFQLLRRLRSPTFSDAFDLVIIDTGPRLTTGSVAALASATHLVVPTIPESRSGDAALRFLRRVSVMKNGSPERPALPRLCPNIQVVGVLPTITGGHQGAVNLQTEEMNALAAAVGADATLANLCPLERIILENQMPRSDTIVKWAQTAIPYFADTETRPIFNRIGREIELRMM